MYLANSTLKMQVSILSHDTRHSRGLDLHVIKHTNKFGQHRIIDYIKEHFLGTQLFQHNFDHFTLKPPTKKVKQNLISRY